MGYFSNGTEGDLYEAKYCNRCIHEDHEKGCPVMLAHVLFAYGAMDETKVVLDILIPRPEVFNEQCAMFVERKPCEHERFDCVACGAWFTDGADDGTMPDGWQPDAEGFTCPEHSLDED